MFNVGELVGNRLEYGDLANVATAGLGGAGNAFGTPPSSAGIQSPSSTNAFSNDILAARHSGNRSSICWK